MKHTTLDCYGCKQHQLEDMKAINDLLNELSYELDLNPICPPVIIPYYYGKVKEDLGVSAYILLEGGHITIHTFPLRECYFVDAFSPVDFDEKKLSYFFMQKLPFNCDNSYINTKNRDIKEFNVLPYDPQADFGPHLMAQIKSNKEVKMEDFFDFLETLVGDINMDPITRAYVIKSSIIEPNYLSGIIIIAQSHIALHYNYETKMIFADIFSCVAFDYTTVNDCISKLGDIVSNVLVARGSKHIYKVKSNVDTDELLANTQWQKVIRKQK